MRDLIYHCLLTRIEEDGAKKGENAIALRRSLKLSFGSLLYWEIQMRSILIAGAFSALFGSVAAQAADISVPPPPPPPVVFAPPPLALFDPFTPIVTAISASLLPPPPPPVVAPPPVVRKY